MTLPFQQRSVRRRPGAPLTQTMSLRSALSTRSLPDVLDHGIEKCESYYGLARPGGDVCGVLPNKALHLTRELARARPARK